MDPRPQEAPEGRAAEVSNPAAQEPAGPQTDLAEPVPAATARPSDQSARLRGVGPGGADAHARGGSGAQGRGVWAREEGRPDLWARVGYADGDLALPRGGGSAPAECWGLSRPASTRRTGAGRRRCPSAWSEAGRKKTP